MGAGVDVGSLVNSGVGEAWCVGVETGVGVVVGVIVALGARVRGRVGVAREGITVDEGAAVEDASDTVGCHIEMRGGRLSTRRSKKRAARLHTQVSVAARPAITAIVISLVRERWFPVSRIIAFS